MYFLLAQIVFALWAIWFAHFQTPCIKAMREYVPMGNPYTKPFHNRGAVASGFVGTIIGLAYFAYTNDWLGCIFLVPPFYFSYRILFDVVIGQKVYGDFFFLGTTAKQDAWINKIFPHETAGEIKVIFCVILILLFNILNHLL